MGDVLTAHLARCRPGVPGELVIGGAGLARGYLNRDEPTAEKPWSPTPFGTAPGGLPSVGAGDLAKRLADGRLRSLADSTSRPYPRHRIELSEVNRRAGRSTVQLHQRAAVVGRQQRDKHLVGYLTGITEQQVSAVREYLDTLLPSYMILSYFVVLDELLPTSSGKVDHRRAGCSPRRTCAEQVEGLATSCSRRRNAGCCAMCSFCRCTTTGSAYTTTSFWLAASSAWAASAADVGDKPHVRVDVALGDFFVSPTAAHSAATIDSARAAASRDDDDLPDAPASLGSRPDAYRPSRRVTTGHRW